VHHGDGILTGIQLASYNAQRNAFQLASWSRYCRSARQRSRQWTNLKNISWKTEVKKKLTI
jgi:hypothetical protein